MRQTTQTFGQRHWRPAARALASAFASAPAFSCAGCQLPAAPVP